MTDDFENRLKALMNDDVDARTGAQRPAPEFDADRVLPRDAVSGPRRRAPWITPLVAAACVVALVGGGLGVSRLVADHDTGAADGPVVSSHPRPSHTPSPTTGTTAQSGPPPTFTTVDGMRIAVPHGWAFKTDPDHAGGDPGTYVHGDSFCFAPVGFGDPCVIHLYRIQPPATAPDYLDFDVDGNGFGLGNAPQYLCDEQPVLHDSVSEVAQDSTFGGRSADFRQWTRSCRGKVVTHEIQTVVATDPGWALYSGDVEQRDPTITFARIRAAFEQIRQRSVLPAARGTVRYMDRGIITSASRGPSGVTVTIDRVLRTEQGLKSVVVNQFHTTYTYVVPTALYDRARVTVGDQVALLTNGISATTFLPDS